MPPPSTPQFRYPALALRLFGSFGDTTILWSIQIVIARLTFLNHRIYALDRRRWTLVGITLCIAASIGYEVVMTVRAGAPLIQRSLGMRVVDAKSARPLTWEQAGLRWLFPSGLRSLHGSILGVLGLAGGVISSGVVIGDSERRRSISDHIAGTVVVLAEPASPAS